MDRNNVDFYLTDLPTPSRPTGAITRGIGSGPALRYEPVGRHNKLVFTNKVITDPSNRVSANLLTVGGTSAPITGTASEGDVLTVSANGYAFQPAGNAVSVATIGEPVTLSTSPSPTGSGFVLSTISATEAVWALQPINNVRISPFTGVGNTASAGAFGSIAIGDGATAGVFRAIAIGDTSRASGAATAVGAQSNADGGESVSVGQQSRADGAKSTALGRAAVAASDQSVAVGELSAASGDGAISIGKSASAQVIDSIAIGRNASATIAGTCVIKATHYVFGANDTGGTALGNYADDIAAAAGGVPLGGEYHNNGLRRVRIA